MVCFICNKRLEQGYLCEEHAMELYRMLINGKDKVEKPSFAHHCNICGEFEDRIIIELKDTGYFCDVDITEAYTSFSKGMSLIDGILDSLADDGESIVQIEQHLNYCEVLNDREIIKSGLVQLLKSGLIYIAYPKNSEISHIEKANNSTIEDYWFELTESGRTEQKKIIID